MPIHRRPVAGAQVTALSPSQSATATTDATGHFAFLTLAPDTYTITATKTGYQPQSIPGQTVFADSVQTVSVRILKALRTIAHVTSTGTGSLVKSGTTADVYSINQTTQRAVAALGGGGNLNSAYSAISTVPGAYVMPNQTGYYDTVHIRGGDFDQVGYEFDGVPVNRSFDNYPSGAASSLGNAEVQVYTGASPANSEGQGLSGFINQVIQTGTYPGFADAQLGIGTPAFYHRAAVEVGGATPDRLFSYYVGIGAYNQAFNYVDNQNGASYDSFIGPPLGPAEQQYLRDRRSVSGAVQLDELLDDHQPRRSRERAHRNPAPLRCGRDDVQILYDSGYLANQFYSSDNDVASPQCGNVGGVACYGKLNPFTNLGFAPGNAGPATPYIDGLQWNCPSAVGKTFSPSGLVALHCASQYFYPSSPTSRPWSNFATGSQYGFISPSYRDGSQNNQEIIKLQYTKNIGSNAFFRVYGYTYYSNWMLQGAQCTAFLYACPTAPDYELSSHTRGISAEFSDQLGAQNLLSIQGSYVTASTIRDNNTQMYNNFLNFGGPARTNAAVLVNAADPYSGYCYSGTGPAPVSCSARRPVAGRHLGPTVRAGS